MAMRNSRRQRDKARQLAKLKAENEQLKTDLQTERNTTWQALSERDKRPPEEQFRQVMEDLKAQVLVLQSDRDRLTAALETCTRRLASPTADKDATRGGWRAANLAASQQYRDQAPVEKKFPLLR